MANDKPRDDGRDLGEIHATVVVTPGPRRRPPRELLAARRVKAALAGLGLVAAAGAAGTVIVDALQAHGPAV
jgi:hypothetical protein